MTDHSHDLSAPLSDSSSNLLKNKTRKRTIRLSRRKFGGARRGRTADLLLAKQALSQLSYGPGTAQQHLNMIKAIALPLSTDKNRFAVAS
tara:strand:- start:224 stop:493 length:270 start_codon:yes stop_codon:yes gene_type:complete